MLTTEQLAAIKQRSAEGYIKRVSAIVSYQLFGKARADIADLIAEVERLQDVIKTKDQALAQFSDKENWEYEPAQYGPEGRKELPCEWYWINVLSPQDLASQALSEGKE